VIDESPGASEPNEELLRYLAGVPAGTHGVADTSPFPANKQELLAVTLEASHYPERIDDALLEIRAYTNGDFHVSYFESHLGGQRRCRWDRHDQPHNVRDHFHPLPNASTAEAEDREYPTDLDRLLSTVVLPWIEHRLDELWSKA
jgi:hypothetical protein